MYIWESEYISHNQQNLILFWLSSPISFQSTYSEHNLVFIHTNINKEINTNTRTHICIEAEQICTLKLNPSVMVQINKMYEKKIQNEHAARCAYTQRVEQSLDIK